eukprot:scaffold28378_cov223-Skeletonema_marinoi.AAC.12
MTFSSPSQDPNLPLAAFSDKLRGIFQLYNNSTIKMNLSLASRHLQLALLTATLLHHHTAHSACNPANKPFNNRLELKTAIDTCFEGDDAATAATIAEYNPQRCERNVKETYGWPMNEWCVGEVDDMQLLFVGKREFNEDISDWDTSKVTDLYETFSYATSFDGDISRWDVSKC